MVRAVDSSLIKYLRFLRNYNTNANIKEIFNLVLGYNMAIQQDTIPTIAKEEWLPRFNSFIEKKLITVYYKNEINRLPKNFGEIIYENQADDKDGLDKFYDILDEFLKQEIKADKE